MKTHTFVDSQIYILIACCVPGMMLNLKHRTMGKMEASDLGTVVVLFLFKLFQNLRYHLKTKENTNWMPQIEMD